MQVAFAVNMIGVRFELERLTRDFERHAEKLMAELRARAKEGNHDR